MRNIGVSCLTTVNIPIRNITFKIMGKAKNNLHPSDSFKTSSVDSFEGRKTEAIATIGRFKLIPNMYTV